MGHIAFLTKSGDEKVKWDKTDAKSLAAAIVEFNSHKKKGWLAFKTDKKGDKTSTQIDAFDPDLEEIIMCPAMSGG